MTTYYFPSGDGAVEYPARNGAAGVQTFQGNGQQAPAGSYIVVTPNTVSAGSPQTYSLIFDYTGPGTGVADTVVQTNYSDANHIETTDGTYDFLLTNSAVPASDQYTFASTSTPFQPSAAIATTDPTCFTTGTLIRTGRGDVAVEELAIGDLALTVAGALRAIRWIGSRFMVRPAHEQCPVRIRAGAFGGGIPGRDLHLSPGHPVLVGADANGAGGQLVPVMCLINGTTVARVPVESVTYWHVELDAHDILLAEGLPAESYIDLGSRPWFGGADGALYDPDLTLPGMPGRCRPVAVDGPGVEAERRRLDIVFRGQLEAACAWSGGVALDGGDPATGGM